MYQFFIDDAQVIDDQVLITGSDVNHISRVLRMKSGEKIRVSTHSGRSFLCHIESLKETEVFAAIEEEDLTGTELPCQIVLYQGLPKSDKMELIIQKGVELGVHSIVPVAMKNCVAKLEPKKIESRIKRWQAIAESAAKQSKRTLIPEVREPLDWKAAFAEACDTMDLVLVPYENERGMDATREIIESIQPGMRIGIMIGPEGGFSPNEIAQVEEIQKAHKISLGRRILRTETAGLAALAMLVYRLDQ